MEDFSLLYWIMEKHTERKEITQTISFGSTKKTRRGKECAVFGWCSNTSTIMKTQLALYIFLHFPHCPQRLNASVTWQRDKITRTGFMLPRILFYVTTIFWKKILKNNLWYGSCYQALFPHKTYQVKPLHQNNKEN